MQAALQWALGAPRLAGVPYRPTFVLLAGFSGALQSGLTIGDLVLATDVIDAHGNSWPASCPFQGGSLFTRSRILTTNSLVSEPSKKQTLGRVFAAVAVDMESATAAQICQEQGMPFGCLRSISDTSDTELSPALVQLLRAGRPSPAAVLATVVRRPALLGELRSLARDTRIAARRLSAGLIALLAAEFAAESSADPR
jgi:adenosylhomocysteine nucleosidase